MRSDFRGLKHHVQLLKFALEPGRHGHHVIELDADKRRDDQGVPLWHGGQFRDVRSNRLIVFTGLFRVPVIVDDDFTVLKRMISPDVLKQLSQVILNGLLTFFITSSESDQNESFVLRRLADFFNPIEKNLTDQMAPGHRRSPFDIQIVSIRGDRVPDGVQLRIGIRKKQRNHNDGRGVQ